jgi:hypothetical protein
MATTRFIDSISRGGRRRAVAAVSLVWAVAALVVTGATSAQAAQRWAPTPYGTGGCLEHAGGGMSAKPGLPEGAKVGWILNPAVTAKTPAVEMGVCINNRNTHGTLFPDVYVNKMPKLSQGPGLGCSLVVEMWDNIGNNFVRGLVDNCALGHHELMYGSTGATKLGWHVTLDSCTIRPLHASAYITYLDGTSLSNQYRIGDSPSFVYCGPKEES